MKNFRFEKLQESNLPWMVDWLQRDHLQEWWRSGVITLSMVREKYLPRIHDKAAAKPFLVYLDEQPFGYIQYYRAADGDPNWWPDQPAKTCIGIDQFIADNNQLGKGYGTAMIQHFIRYISAKIRITEVRADPRPGNRRAIRCYQKAGFQSYGNITTPDGPAVLMKLTMENFE